MHPKVGTLNLTFLQEQSGRWTEAKKVLATQLPSHRKVLLVRVQGSHFMENVNTAEKWQNSLTKWSAPIPQPVRQRDRKRCYIYWKVSQYWRADGKVVWLTDAEVTLAHIKYSNLHLEEVLERDSLEEYKKYLDQTID